VSRRLVALAVAACACAAPALATDTGVIGPSTHIVNLGRKLEPYGRQVTVGNVPTGGALTPDGRFYWTVSAGAGANDVRIVDVRTAKVVQTLPLPGASGGVAIARNGTAFVSGLKNTANLGVSRPDLPGGGGDVVHVYSYAKTSGIAKETRTISVAPPSGTAPPQDFPIPETKPLGYPEHLAVTPDGRTLLVPLGLADGAQIVDVRAGTARFVATGRYPYAAAILPGGRRGLVTNESPGTVSVVDLRTARKIKDIKVGGALSHPEAVIAHGALAYVTVTNLDRVAVIDVKKLRVRRDLQVKPGAGAGAWPDALATDGRRLFVAEAGADRVAVFATSGSFRQLGRIPTARYPTDVQTSHGKLIWLSAKALGTGPNPHGPSPFSSSTLNQTDTQSQFLPRITDGSAGVGAVPSAKRLRSLTTQADAQLEPANLPARAPAGTVVRPNGPIKHVFFIVKENRTYDQVLGDVAGGDGDANLTLFGRQNTPNQHAIVARFPLLDHVYADSEASQQGHQWTSAGNISDFEEKNWNQITSGFGSYGDRGRPLETGVLSISFPPKGYLFDQAARQKISYFNYGEVYAGNFPLPYQPVPIIANTKDVDRTPALATAAMDKFNHSDLGPQINNGCFPNAFYAGTTDILTGNEVFDSSVPNGAPAGSESRFDCFKSHFEAQLASAAGVPAFNYLTLAQDHTAGLKAGSRTPQAFVADNDAGVGQVVDLISHSPIWSSSAIFVVEDDSQDGADHVDAHRIPAYVASPYAKPGVVHDRYDQLSVLRTMELMLGMKPLYVTDALATPMYDAFATTAVNSVPFDALPETVDVLARNPSGTRGARASAGLPWGTLDAVPQHKLDNLLWRAVKGWRSTPPPPGPNAVKGADAGG
jgi:DNA-binding beta-propeller fold protein YncE